MINDNQKKMIFSEHAIWFKLSNTLQGLIMLYHHHHHYRWQRLHLFWIAQFLTIKTKLKTSRNTTWQYINRSNDDDDVHHSILHHHHHNHHEYHQHCYDDGDHSNYMIIIQTTHSLSMKPFKFIIKPTSPLDLQLWRRPICWYAKRQLIWWLVHKIISPYANMKKSFFLRLFVWKKDKRSETKTNHLSRTTKLVYYLHSYEYTFERIG